jgi:hypothetical protein
MAARGQVDKMVGYGEPGMILPRSVVFHRPQVGRMGFWAYTPIAAALVMRLASGPTANLSYLALAAYALLGRAYAIRALALSWLFTMINPGIAPEASADTVGRYAVLAAAAGSVLISRIAATRKPRVNRLARATIALGIFIVGHSLLFSPMVAVSVLKALSWTVAMATSAAAWSGMPDSQREDVSRQLFWGLVVLLVASLPLAALPVGYLRNGTGFQGWLNQPQAFGEAIAHLGGWAAGRLFGEARPPWWLVGLVAACLALIFMSEARTGGLALVFGVGLAVLTAPRFAGRPFGEMLPGLKSKRVWLVLIAALFSGLALAPIIEGRVHYFMTKSGRVDVDSLVGAYDDSRGGKIDAMVGNIVDHPLTGIGFGIASDPAVMVVKRDPVLGLPIGASVEKGVAPLAVWEELGLLGAIAVGLWLLRLLRGGARCGLAPFAVCLTALMINMGDATLFSAGGFGLLPLILFGWAYASGMQARRRHG